MEPTRDQSPVLHTLGVQDSGLFGSDVSSWYCSGSNFELHSPNSQLHMQKLAHDRARKN